VNIEVIGVDDFETRVVKQLVSKQLWLDAAEVFDAWRVFPRSLLASFATMSIHISYTLAYWYMHLPSAERTEHDAIAVGSIITVLTTLLGVFTKFYMDTGRKWSKD
jgi:hypothetical protein